MMNNILKTRTHRNPNRLKNTAEDRMMYLIVNAVLIVTMLVFAYPIVFVLSASFSSPLAVSTGRVVLLPVDFGFEGFKAVFSYKYVLSGYRNTIFYTVAGTAINVTLTMACAYPLSRRDFPTRRFFMFLFLFTMFFSGGLIPTYILMVQIHFINKIWAMLIPGAVSVFYMILVRTFLISSIPNDLLEASQIDGCSDMQYFFSILLPLSRAVIAVITLFYAVDHWNAYFNALIYLKDQQLYPLQIILRNILVANQINLSDIKDVESLIAKQGLSDLLKYSLIIVSSAPIIALYPFVQRYFIQGVMIGSIKG